MAEIQNFGEHIGGSRADLWKAGKLLWNEITGMTDEEVITYVTRDSIWTREKPEDAVYKNGKSSELAYYQNAMRTAVLPKPSRGGKEAAEDYAKTVTAIRDMVMGADRVGYGLDPETGTQRPIKDLIFENFTTRASFYSVNINNEAKPAIDGKLIKTIQYTPARFKKEAEKKAYGLTKEDAIERAAIRAYKVYPYKGIVEREEYRKLSLNERSEHGAFFVKDEIFDKEGKRLTEEKDGKAIPARAILNVPQSFGTSFYYIYGNNETLQPEKWQDNSYFIINEATRSIVKNNLSKEDADLLVKECIEIDKCLKLKDIEDNSKARTQRKGKKQFVPETLKNIERTGADDFTKGRSITGDDMLKAFGFRGGEFGNWTSQEERQANLNMCFNALKDLAGVLGMDSRDISLNGDLSIAFGARGRGRALAHYEPTYKVINLTKETVTKKTGGAGALAHEWGHALDAKLGDIAGYKCTLLSDKHDVDRYRLEKNEKVPKAMIKILRAMKYKKTTEKIDYTKKIRFNIDNLKAYVDRYIKPKELTPEQEERWNKALQVVIDNAQPSYMYPMGGKGKLLDLSDGDSHGLDELAALKAELSGDKLTKPEKESIISFCSTIYYDRERDAKQNEGPVERKVQTDFFKGSDIFDKNYSKSDKGYWASSCEMFARAFDCYVADKLKEAGIRDGYLTAYADSYKVKEDDKVISAVPVGEERETLNRLFDELIQEIHEMELFHEPEPEIDEVFVEEEIFRDVDMKFNHKVFIPKEMEPVMSQIKDTLGFTGDHLISERSDGYIVTLGAMSRARRLKDIADTYAKRAGIDAEATRYQSDKEEVKVDVARAEFPDIDTLWAVADVMRNKGINVIQEDDIHMPGAGSYSIFIDAHDKKKADAVYTEVMEDIEKMARLDIPCHGGMDGFMTATRGLESEGHFDYLGGYMAVFCPAERAEDYAKIISQAIKNEYPSWPDTMPTVSMPKGYQEEQRNHEIAAAVAMGEFSQMDLFSYMSETQDR